MISYKLLYIVFLSLIGQPLTHYTFFKDDLTLALLERRELKLQKKLKMHKWSFIKGKSNFTC